MATKRKYRGAEPGPGLLERRIKWIAAATGHNVTSLSLACGLGRATLSARIYRERAQGHAELEGTSVKKICEYTGLTPEFVLFGDPEEPPPLTQVKSKESAAKAAPDVEGGSVSLGLVRQVVEALCTDDRVPEPEAEGAIGRIVFGDRWSGTSALELYRAAKRELGLVEGEARPAQARGGSNEAKALARQKTRKQRTA